MVADGLSGKYWMKFIPVFVMLYTLVVFSYPVFQTNIFSDEINFIGKRLFLPQVNLFTFYEERSWVLNKIEIIGVKDNGEKVMLYEPPNAYIVGLSRDLALFSVFNNLARRQNIPSENEIKEYLEGKSVLEGITAKTRLKKTEFDIRYTQQNELLGFIKQFCGKEDLKIFINLDYLNKTGVKVNRDILIGEIVCE